MAKTEHTEAIAGELIAPTAGIDIERIAELGAKAAGADLVIVKAPAGMTGVPEEIPALLVRGERPELHPVKRFIEDFREHPQRRKGTAMAETLESFNALVDRHKTAASVIFADTGWTAPAFTAVIDYHEAKGGGTADWLGHRVVYKFPLSEEWKAWTAMNGEKMDQAQFAAFLEDRIADLASPTEGEKAMYERDFATRVATPAELINLSRGLAVHVDQQVKSAVTLQSGEGQIAWEELHKDSDGKPLKIPGMFMLKVAPFFMGEKTAVPVRLRYRPANGRILWFYQIYRPDIVITEQVRRDLGTAAQATGLPAFEGAPEA